jgi:Protein of unknown function (DUF2934)
MPRPKSPKKSPSAEEVVPRSTTAPVPNPHNGSPEAIAAGPAAAETAKTHMKTAIPRKPRKPVIVKVEPRSNLVPINLEDEIRRLAYLLSERRGFVPGHETDDWVSAEREIRERYHQQSA